MSASDFASSNAGGWDDIGRAASRRAAGKEEPLLLRELLQFRLAGSAYAIPVERVREIVRLRGITPMPRVPAAILGVIALRGEIVQVVDLRMRLRLDTPAVGRASRVIVLHGDDDRVTGVLVDGVQEVLRVTEDEVRAATGGDASFVSELVVRGSEFVSLVDLDRVLDLDANQ
jgi:purine-binding chemotaxis protein CheW